MRGSGGSKSGYGTVNDNDDASLGRDVESQMASRDEHHHRRATSSLSSSSSSSRYHLNNKPQHYYKRDSNRTIATRVAILSVAAMASLAVVRKTTEKTLRGGPAAGPRHEILGSVDDIKPPSPNDTNNNGGLNENNVDRDASAGAASEMDVVRDGSEIASSSSSSAAMSTLMPKFDWKKTRSSLWEKRDFPSLDMKKKIKNLMMHSSSSSSSRAEDDEEEDEVAGEDDEGERERSRSGNDASSSSSSSRLPSLGASRGSKQGVSKNNKKDITSSGVASLGGKNKIEDDIGFDSLLKNPPKKKVEKPKPKPKVVEKPKKEDKKKKESSKKKEEKKSDDEEKEEAQKEVVPEKPQPYDSTDMLSKIPTSTTLSAADILAREGQDASSLLVNDAPNDTEDALSQDIGLILDDNVATPSAGTLAAASAATTADAFQSQQPTVTLEPQQSSSATLPTPEPPIITSSSFSNGVVPPRPPMVVDSSASTTTTTDETSSSGPDLSSMDVLPDDDVNLDVDDPSGRVSSDQEDEDEEEEDRARGHVDDEEDIVVADDDDSESAADEESAPTEQEEAVVQEVPAVEEPAPAEQPAPEQQQQEQQQQQQQVEMQQQQQQQVEMQQQQQLPQQQLQQQQFYQPQQQQPINFQPKIIIPKQKSSRRKNSNGQLQQQQSLGVSQEDLEEKMEEASANAVGNVVDAFVGKLDNAANAARAGPKAVERSLSPMDRLTESIARILNDKEEENKERRSSRRRYDYDDDYDYDERDERDRRRRRDDRRRDDYDYDERDYRRREDRQTLGEPMSTEERLNQKMRDLGVEDAIAEKQRREDDARMGEMIKQKLSLMDPDIVEDKPYLEPTQLEMNQIVERTLKKLGIEDIAKREKDTKMEEKLEQIIAEKFDKMGLNNDDDDDEEDNLAPFRKGKKASRIEKRVQKAVAGIENKLYANTFGQFNGNQQMQPQMGIPMVQQPYGYQPQPVLYDQFGRLVVTAPQPYVQQQPQEIPGHTEKDRTEDAIQRMEALFESKMKEKDQPSPSTSSASAYARAKVSPSARGDDDMPSNLDDISLDDDDDDVLSNKRETGGADEEPDLEALRKEVAQVVAQSIEEKQAAAQKQVLTAEQQLKEKLDSWKTNEATKDMDADFQAMQQTETQPTASTTSLTTDVQSAADKVKAMLLGGNGADLTSSSDSVVPTATAAVVPDAAGAAVVPQQQQQAQQVPVATQQAQQQQPVATLVDPSTGQPVMATQPAAVAVPVTTAATAVTPTTEEPAVEAAVPTGEVVKEKPAKKEKKPKKLSDMDIIMGGLNDDDDDDDKSSKKSKKSSKKAKKDPWGDDIKSSKADKEEKADEDSSAVASKDDSVLDNIGGDDDVDSILADYEAAK